ncbi:MAG: hypothetical protein HYR97_07780 [Candidatus Melainabacteria bacterium]|nr:hypothetical protein [Candidatus Melainabacteria bacterium]
MFKVFNRPFIILCIINFSFNNCFALAYNGCGDGVLSLTEECERNYDCGMNEVCNARCSCINPLSFKMKKDSEIIDTNVICNAANGEKCEIGTAEINVIY